MKVNDCATDSDDANGDDEGGGARPCMPLLSESLFEDACPSVPRCPHYMPCVIVVDARALEMVVLGLIASAVFLHVSRLTMPTHM